MSNYVQPVDYQPPQQYVPDVQYQQQQGQYQQFTTTNEFDILTQSPVYTVVEKLIAHIQIPDKVDFEHKFSKKVPCCEMGELRMTSEFAIQGLGEFLFSLGMNLCCGNVCNLALCCGCELGDCNCDHHDYPYKMYEIKNKAIEMEYWHKGIGKITVGDRPIINFHQTDPNGSDYFYGHFCSSYPKLRISYPFEPNNFIVIAPEINQYPESCIGLCGCLAPLQLMKLSRNFVVVGLKQGRCQIVNSRTFPQAAAKAFFCQGQCCCPIVDYPEFTVIFEGVRQLDKIAILMGLMHIAFYKHWCFTGSDHLSIKYSPIM